MKKRKNDILLLAVVLVLAGLLWLGLRLFQGEGATVRVTIDGAEYGSYPLNKAQTITIGDEEHFNLLVIEDGAASIAEASCPDKLCVRQGKAAFNGQSIICLPNKVVVEVLGGEQRESDVVVR